MCKYNRNPLPERFWSKVNIGSPDECWEWQGFRHKLGYGRIAFGNGKNWAAHRVSWYLSNGPIPDGLCVLHKCDNRACVNPDHLFLGTQIDNIRDMNNKGRRRSNPLANSGEKSASAKLTATDVIEIRRLSKAGMTTIFLGKKYGVCFQQISRIIHKERWKHIP